MAEPAENPFEEAKPDKPATGDRKKVVIRLGLMVAVLGIGTAGGFSLGGVFHHSAKAEPNAPPVQEQAFEEKFAPAPEGAGDEFEYVDFEPIVVNLNEPRLARYIRATLVLAVAKKDFPLAGPQITKKTKELRNWMTVYFNGRTLEDVRGPRCLSVIQREIQDACNEMLWPKRRGLISHVLFKEFAVQ